MNNISIIIEAVCIVSITVIIVYICNWMYMTQEKKQHAKELAGFKLLNKDVSYEKYLKIVRRSSVANNPIRKNGDFLDFIMECDDSLEGSPKLLENKLFCFNCGGFVE